MPRSRADVTPAEIRFMLNRKGLTFADVDRKFGLKEGTCRKTARQPYPEGETALAEVLSRKPHRIWPSRYDAQGNRLKPQPGENYTKQPTIRTVKKGAA